MNGLYFDARSGLEARTTGWERYTRGLMSTLRSLGAPITFGGNPSGSLAARLLGDLVAVTRIAGAYRAAHFPSYPPLPQPGRQRSIIMYTLYDLTWWRYSETSTPLGRHYYRPLAEKHLRQRRPVFTISDSVRGELVSDWGYRDEDVAVVPPGLDPLFAENEPGFRRRDNILLSVATSEPRKNLRRLLLAWQASGCARTHQLVLVGRRREELSLGGISGVLMLGAVSDEDLLGLYQRAAGLVLPSLYEGFGLPIIEAISQQLPIVCSDIPVFREVAGDLPIFFDPLSIDAMAGAISSFCRRPRVAGVSQHLDVRRDFSWRASGEAQMAAYRQFGVDL